MKNFISSYDFVKTCIEKNDVRSIFNALDYFFVEKNKIEYSNEAEVIFDLLEKFGTGFIVDICKRAKNDNIRLSDKQRWCLAFALMKITVEQVEEYEGESKGESKAESVEERESYKKEIIAEAEAGKDVVFIDGITLKVINKHDSIILHDFPKWKDTERIADVLQLDTFDRQPVIIRQRSGLAAWKWEIVGPTDDGISYNDNINPHTGEEDHSTYMKLEEDSFIYEVAIIFQK